MWSRDDKSGEEGFAEVVETYVRDAEELVRLTYTTSAHQDVSGAWEFGSEDTLVGTSEHPFWSQTRHAWVPMGQLARGERLLLATGEEATVKAARVEAAGRDGLGRAIQTPVYNFQVKGWHSYFAAPNEGATLGEFAWVHNGQYRPIGRASKADLFSKERPAKGKANVFENRRTISKADIGKERAKFLGESPVKVEPGKWRSADAKRQFRVKPADYAGTHGKGPHVHFEELGKTAGGKLKVTKNVHVPLG